MFPARHGFAITPSDTTVLSPYTQAIYITGAGTLSVLLADDTTVTNFGTIAAGTFLELCCQKVMATGTSATGIVGLA